MIRAIIVPQAHETNIKVVLPANANLSARGTSRQTWPARRRISRNSERNPGVEGGSVVMAGPKESGVRDCDSRPWLVRMAAAVFAQAGAQVTGPGGVAFFPVERRAHEFLQMSRLRVQE